MWVLAISSLTFCQQIEDLLKLFSKIIDILIITERIQGFPSSYRPDRDTKNRSNSIYQRSKILVTYTFSDNNKTMLIDLIH